MDKAQLLKRGRKSKRKNAETNISRDSSNSDLEIQDNKDDNQLTAIFPEEVWLLILLNKFGYKTKNGSNTLTNVSLASPYFRNILAEQRKIFLFPKVLSSLATWLEKEENKIGPTCDSSDESEGESEESTDSDSESVFQLTDIYKCRHVCPEWNHVFTNFYQNPNRYTLMKHDQDKLSRNLGTILLSSYGMNLEEIPAASAEFLNHFEETHANGSIRNPFPVRALNFDTMVDTDPPNVEDQNFLEGISTILEKYGSNLLYCRMELQDETSDRIDFYEQFRQWLNFMPNLKTFKLRYCHTVIGPMTREQDQILEQEANNLNPLPKLESLKYLKVTYPPPVIFNQLIQTSGQGIIQLQICQRKEDNSNDAAYYNIYSELHPLLQLKELSIDFDSEKQFERMENSEVAANWKLEKFYFLYINDDDVDFIDWSRVFKMVANKWSASIKNLVLQMPVPTSSKERDLVANATLSTTILSLPNLKRVKLIVKVPCSIDFLLASVNTLECIEIIADYIVDDEKKKPFYKSLKRKQQVKFLGSEDSKNRFASNILEKFPKLNFVSIVTTLNPNRKGFEKYGCKQWYRFCSYKAKEMKSEDRLVYPGRVAWSRKYFET